MKNILVCHPSGRWYATLKNAPCVFYACLSARYDKNRSRLVFIQNGFKILFKQRHLAGIFFFVLSVFD